MANHSISMSKLRQILKLHFQGKGTKKTSDIVRVSRNTVKKYLVRFRVLRLTFAELSVLSDTELDKLFNLDYNPISEPTAKLQHLYNFFPLAEKRLKQTGMTLVRLWADYIESHPDGYRQTAFYHYYKIWKKKSHPSMHMEHKAGEKMFVDYAGEKLEIIDEFTGEIIEVEVFVAILGASQLTYVEAIESQRMEDFIIACENALHYFGGSPLAITPDNLKSAVIKSHRYEPELNWNFEAFAQHYSMTVVPARSYKPKDKSLVEGAVKIAYRRIYTELQGKVYHCVKGLNEAIKTHLLKHNDKKFQGRNYSRNEQFEEMEKQSLQELPLTRFEIRQQVIVTVMKNYHICLGCDKHYYSVPYEYQGKKVKVLFSKSLVQIYYKYVLIAEHKRIKSPHNYTTLAEHVPPQHKVVGQWSAEFFLNQARDIHPDVERYIQGVLNKKAYAEQAYRSCQGILSFAKRLSHERLTRACQRALEVGWFNFKTIETILAKGLDKENPDETQLQMPLHENIRGGNYYQ